MDDRQKFGPPSCLRNSNLVTRNAIECGLGLRRLVIFVALMGFTSSGLSKEPPIFERLVVLGDSLSDMGNVILRWEKLEQRAMTTSKRQSHDKARRAGSEPNLGQKAAEREKKSKAQLSHMEGRRATSARGRFVAWCKQEQASIQQQLELMQSGKVLTGENRGSGWVDTTDESVKRAKARLVELESLLTEKGSATISKP